MEIVKDFPRTSQRTFAVKIDQSFLALLGSVYSASYQPPAQKILTITKAIEHLDIVKFLLSIAWESEVLGNNRYLQISKDLDEIGRMLGGWKKGLEKTNSLRK